MALLHPGAHMSITKGDNAQKRPPTSNSLDVLWRRQSNRDHLIVSFLGPSSITPPHPKTPVRPKRGQQKRFPVWRYHGIIFQVPYQTIRQDPDPPARPWSDTPDNPYPPQHRDSASTRPELDQRATDSVAPYSTG